MTWLFWRTRRIWPLILGHNLWDTLAIQVVISPSLQVRGYSALAIFGWGVTGVTLAIIAAHRSRQQRQYAHTYYRPQQG